MTSTMTNKGQLLQDPYLNLLRREHVPVSIYLVNGIKLIELLPENPEFKIITVDPEEPFAIEGLAVGLIRNTMLM